MKHTVISIGRQFGSGGHEIAIHLGKLLSLPVYDDEMISIACGIGDVREEILRPEDEKPVNPLLFRTMHEGNEKVKRGDPAGKVLFELQSMAIRHLAKENDCIIVGRCADFVLEKEDVNVISVFVKAPLEARIERKMKLESMPYAKVKKQVEKKDRQRQKYYESHTGRIWGEEGTYDLVIDTGNVSLEDAADLIAQRFRSVKG